jgi:hypothetical protein
MATPVAGRRRETSVSSISAENPPSANMPADVQAMLRLDRQLIALDTRARVIGRPQPDQLRA